jgi:indole-3-glycerol phosphate synthase
MILDEIYKYKIIELEEKKKLVSFDTIKEEALKMKREIRNFPNALTAVDISLIAEIKYVSPSEGKILNLVDVEKRASDYESAGASAISVLTDEKYFGGNLSFLEKARTKTSIPILRKDFLFDPYHIYESYVHGADAVLFIARMLDEEQLKTLVTLTHDLGLFCLVEIRSEEELEKALKTDAQVIGMNTRDLQTFEVNLDITNKLIPMIPKDRIVVAESGIHNNQDVKFVKEAGADAILVGTSLMKTDNVADKINELLSV